MVYVSKKFIQAVRTSPARNYRLALTSGIHPTYLSKIINHAAQVKFGDPKIIILGGLLSLPPEQCFSEKSNESP